MPAQLILGLGTNLHGHGKEGKFIMWKYEKKLQYPVNIKKKDLKLAKYILTQYGGPAGELAAAWQYLDQRYIMPDDRGKALLTDIGTEEYDLQCCLLKKL